MKTYRKPKAKIVNTKGHVILAGSPGFNNGEAEGGDAKSTRGIFEYVD